MSLGHNLKNILATIVLIAAIGLTAPVQAKVLAQYWTPDEFFAIDETNCAGEDGYVQLMSHVTVVDMPQGALGIHVNRRGTWTGLVTGTESKWLDNLVNVLPILGEGFVHTQIFTIRIVGQRGNNFYLRAKQHITIMGGEIITNIDSQTIDCKVD
jgi:hypothetical protein